MSSGRHSGSIVLYLDDGTVISRDNVTVLEVNTVLADKPITYYTVTLMKEVEDADSGTDA